MPRLVGRHPEHYAAVSDEMIEAAASKQGYNVLQFLRHCAVPSEYDVLQSCHFVPRWALELYDGWFYGVQRFTEFAQIANKLTPAQAEEFVQAVHTVARLTDGIGLATYVLEARKTYLGVE